MSWRNLLNVQNVEKGFFSSSKSYGIPDINKDEFEVKELIPYRVDSNRNGTAHFFLDDYRFERCWKNADSQIKELKKYNVKTIMLTGDNKQTAEKIGKELEITEVISNVLPSQKSDTIKSLKENGNKVMMCGDGINDSPAITNADIGVSVKSGTDIAMDSSDVILTKNDLNSILKLIKISEKTIKNIKQNLFWAFFYNCLMIPVAIGLLKPFGISINPMIASLAMVFSSFTVILNALRLRRSFRAGR